VVFKKRISTARLIAAPGPLCRCTGTSVAQKKTCPQLKSVMGSACKDGDCLNREKFLTLLISTASSNSTGRTPSDSSARTANNDALWSRNWVFCPHSQKASGGAIRESVDTPNGCKGSVSKKAWLNHTTRAQECAAVIGENIQEDATSIDFCLLNAETQDLCNRMESWHQRTEKILCEAAGACPVTDFFYTPTTFNIQEQEFVHSTVLRFYQKDAGRSCPAPTREQKKILQTQSNEHVYNISAYQGAGIWALRQCLS
jgi:hypothetical protein